MAIRPTCSCLALPSPRRPSPSSRSSSRSRPSASSSPSVHGTRASLTERRFGVGSTWTVFHHLVFWGSLSVYFLFISLYGLIPHVRGWDNHIYWAFCTCAAAAPLSSLPPPGEICDRQSNTANHLGCSHLPVTLFKSSSFWLTYITLVVCSLLPDVACKRCCNPLLRSLTYAQLHGANECVGCVDG
jgi:hypothetical protein